MRESVIFILLATAIIEAQFFSSARILGVSLPLTLIVCLWLIHKQWTSTSWLLLGVMISGYLLDAISALNSGLQVIALFCGVITTQLIRALWKQNNSKQRALISNLAAISVYYFVSSGWPDIEFSQRVINLGLFLSISLASLMVLHIASRTTERIL